MFGSFKFKLLVLFCLTFFVGLISFDTFSPKQQVELPKISESKINKTVVEAIELLEKDNFECISADGNLKYRHIENKVFEFNSKENEISDMEKLSNLNEKILLLKEKIKSEKSFDIEKRVELEKELKILKDKFNKLIKEQFKIDDSIDLLYREVCKETK